MAWIKMRTDLERDPAVIRLSEHYGWPEHTIVGILHKVWSWADEQLSDGNATGVTKTFIDRYTGVTDLGEQLEKVGWLEETSEGFAFPNWEVHMSQTAKKRAETAVRVKKSRSKTRNAKSVTKALPDKRREDKNKNKGKRTADGSDCRSTKLPFESEVFRQAWLEWVSHRNEIRKPLTPTSIKRQLSKFRQWGESRSIAAMCHTIEKGWQGLQEPTSAGNRPDRPIDKFWSKDEI